MLTQRRRRSPSIEPAVILKCDFILDFMKKTFVYKMKAQKVVVYMFLNV